MPPKIEIVREWIELARVDLLSANALLDADVALQRTACFHCQQAVEKTLKAFLQWQEVRSAKIHDLRRLVDLCQSVEAEFETLRPRVEWLNEFAVDIRYPGFGPPPTTERAREAWAAAAAAVDFVLARLPREAHA